MCYICSILITLNHIAYEKNSLICFSRHRVSLIAPQTAKAQGQIDNGYEIEVVYNKIDKTTTVILYKGGVEVGRVTKPAN